MSKRAKPQPEIPPKAPAFRRVALPALLFLATLLAYLPALRAGWVWDDDSYVTKNPTLIDASGLARMWTDVTALPQWYPLVHTTFWLERRVYGLNPAGYHLDNVLLHAASAVLLFVLLRRLTVPGALLGAALFALHPVQVESVAWVTERKNVLSGLFYFAAFLAYLKFMPEPLAATQSESNPPNRWRAYALALVLFLCALLSKTVTASLPAAILVVIWWRRGRINLKTDVLPLVPFFILGAGLAALTGHLERTHVGAVGPEWRYAATPLGEAAARTLIAGRAVWFYLAKLIWPHPLMFIYPRWHIDPSAWWQWLCPAGVLAVLAALVLLRNRIGRGPAAGALLFVGTLVPALGFANVYPHRYSFVADHFQYLACVGVFALVGAGAARWATRLKAWTWAVPCLVLVPLAGLTFARCFAYRDSETLWRDNLAKNPTSWAVLTNLGNALAAEGRTAEAAALYGRALAAAPEIADVQWNAGMVDMGAATATPPPAPPRRAALVDSAQKHFGRAIELRPEFGPAYESLANLLVDERHDPAAARAVLERAIGYFPDSPNAYLLLGRVEEAAGDLPAAQRRYEQAAARGAHSFAAQFALGTVRLRRREFDAALAPLTAATALDPSVPEAWANLGAAYESTRQPLEAAGAYARALGADPNFAPARAGLARLRGR